MAPNHVHCVVFTSSILHRCRSHYSPTDGHDFPRTSWRPGAVSGPLRAGDIDNSDTCAPQQRTAVFDGPMERSTKTHSTSRRPTRPWSCPWRLTVKADSHQAGARDRGGLTVAKVSPRLAPSGGQDIRRWPCMPRGLWVETLRSMLAIAHTMRHPVNEPGSSCFPVDSAAAEEDVLTFVEAFST